ncbi:MAG: hypothetical protein ABJA57_10205 [Ginsengibacter sp.]
MEQYKIDFLKNDFIPLLTRLKCDDQGKWGVMHAQQMVEHFIEAVESASGKLILPMINEGERLIKSRDFLLSDIPFKENTKNPLMSEIPVPALYPGMQPAIEKLQEELSYFFQVFSNTPGLKTKNPFFGDLNYEENIQLLYKHAFHHLTQFNLRSADLPGQ